MPVSLSPAVAPTIKIQIGCNIRQAPQPICQRLVSRQKPPGAAGYLPNEQRLISARPSQSYRRIELYDATVKSHRIES